MLRYLFIVFLFLVSTSCSDTKKIDQISAISIAKQYFQKKQYEKSADILKKVEDPKLIGKEYHLMLGLSLFRLGDFENAIIAFEKARPKSLEMKIYIAYLYLLTGDSQTAERMTNILETEYGKTANIFILKGNLALKMELFKKARIQFNRAIELDNSSIKPIIGIANSYFMERNYIKAEKNYLKAVFLSENSIDAYIALSRFYQGMNRYKDAENNLKIAVDNDPDNKSLLIQLVSLYIKLGNSQEAIKTLERALTLYPGTFNLWIKKVRIYLDSNQLEEAHHTIQKILSDYKENYYTYLLMGEYYLRKNDLNLALYNLNKAVGINPESYEVNYYLGLIHLIEKNVRSARMYLEKSIIIYPGFQSSHLLLANIYLSEKRYKLAAEHSKFVLQLDPDNTSGHLINGVSLFFQGLHREAEYEFDVTQKLDPTNQAIYLLKAIVALNDNNKSDAQKAISSIDNQNIEKLFFELELFKLAGVKKIEKKINAYLKKSPNYMTYLLIGSYYKERGEPELAVKLFNKSLALNEQSAVTYYYLAEMESSQGNVESAISYLNKTIEIDDTFLKSYQALGGLYEVLKDYDNAKRIYKKGLAFYPENSMLLNNLAWIELEHFSDLDSAYAHVHTAINISPEDPDIIDTRAWLHYNSGEYEKAISKLNTIAVEYPDNPLYLFHLGMAYFKNSEKSLAKMTLKKALELNIGEPHKIKIMKALSL